MNIYQAFAKNRPFKRPCWGYWIDPKELSNKVSYTGYDMLATDYVNEDPKRSLTRADIKLAWEYAMTDDKNGLVNLNNLLIALKL